MSKDDNNAEEQAWIWDQLGFFDNIKVDDDDDYVGVDIGLAEEVMMLEASRITSALEKFNYNRTHAANDLGIGRTLLIHKIKKYELNNKTPKLQIF